MDLKYLKISISGLVQGVGFRPFIFRLAARFGLVGEVFNDSQGVKIFICGSEVDCDKFCDLIFTELPPLARIDSFLVDNVFFDSFKFNGKFIISESRNSEKLSPILPDFAICDDCVREFYDKKNRRYHYPFINCTNCGPRFSIISSLPYDRKNTSMEHFVMCKDCQNEYKNPSDRRYHAQPISCFNCGPSLSFYDKYGKKIPGDAVRMCADALKNGKIVAIKGIGGFHLVANAMNYDVINSLRIRKNRPDKPFAIMCKDLNMVKKFAYLKRIEEELLTSKIKPIVLLKSRKKLPSNLNDNLDGVGIFLPPTALHLSLFEQISDPLIATSANISSEPILTSFNEILSKLGGVVDFILDHDRAIINPSDDSIAFCVNDKTQWIRASRGIKPRIIKTKFNQNGTFLAIGSELKNEFAIYTNGMIISSPYIGDLKNIATFERFKLILTMFERTYDLKFDFVVADFHPHFMHTKFFEKLGYKIHRIGHHHAHILSVMFENDLNCNVLGFAFDGTGYARNSQDEAEIWGGEVMLCDKNTNFKRILHFDEFALIGGDNAIKKIHHLAYAILKKYDILADEFLSKFDQRKLNNLDIMMKKSIKTSSLGRIFDAFACIVLDIFEISYDAQAAMKLEALYDDSLDVAYEFKIKNEKIEYKEVFLGALNDEPKVAATAFINGLANLILTVVLSYDKSLPVVLSGGVFQNKALLKNVIDKFLVNKIEFYLPKNETSNDSAIAMGQIYYGLNLLN